MWDQWKDQGGLDIRQKAEHKAHQLLGFTPKDLQPSGTKEIFDSIISEAQTELVPY